MRRGSDSLHPGEKCVRTRMKQAGQGPRNATIDTAEESTGRAGKRSNESRWRKGRLAREPRFRQPPRHPEKIGLDQTVSDPVSP
jgi:hypothetical protein